MKFLRREWWLIVLMVSVAAFAIFYWIVAGAHATITFRKFESRAGAEVAVFMLKNESVHRLRHRQSTAGFARVFGPQCYADTGGSVEPGEEAEIIAVRDAISSSSTIATFTIELEIFRTDIDDDHASRRLQRWLPSWLRMDDSRVLRATVVKA